MLTAGEWLSAKSLFVSQVLEPATLLISKGYTVQLYAAIPLLSYLKRKLLGQQDLIELINLCKELNIEFNYQIIPVTLGSPYSFWCRRFFHQKVARKLAKQIRNEEAYVLHARSYYAAEIALFVKTHTQQQANTIVSFDLRSLLPNEVAIEFGCIGKALFGFFKELEYNLLKGANVSFVPLNYAQTYLQQETGTNILYAPIQGFDRASGWISSFDQRWEGKKIGYSGSLGVWNDVELLKAVFRSFDGYVPSLAVVPTNELAAYENKFYSQKELPSYYDSLLALVIPGLMEVEGYFLTAKMRCNFFSTKASEALSRGVPLIVNAELHELAEFVTKHECGLVFTRANNQLFFNEIISEITKEKWEKLAANAAEIGKTFTRSHVLTIYEQAWEKALHHVE